MSDTPKGPLLFSVLTMAAQEEFPEMGGPAKAPPQSPGVSCAWPSTICLCNKGAWPQVTKSRMTQKPERHLLLWPAVSGNSDIWETVNQFARAVEGGWPLHSPAHAQAGSSHWMHPPPFLASLASQEQSPSNFNTHGNRLMSLLNTLLGPCQRSHGVLIPTRLPQRNLFLFSDPC